MGQLSACRRAESSHSLAVVIAAVRARALENAEALRNTAAGVGTAERGAAVLAGDAALGVARALRDARVSPVVELRVDVLLEVRHEVLQVEVGRSRGGLSGLAGSGLDGGQGGEGSEEDGLELHFG